MRKELTKITRCKQSLYQDWKDGEITQQECWDIKTDYEQQVAELADVLAQLIYENGNISVHFKFADELRRIAEYIVINTTDSYDILRNNFFKHHKIKVYSSDSLTKRARHIVQKNKSKNS